MTYKVRVLPGQIIKKVSAYVGQFAQSACRLCSDKTHLLKSCPQFLAMNVDDCVKAVQKYNLCMNRLAHSYIARDCKSPLNSLSCHQRTLSLPHRYPTENRAATQPSRPITHKQ